MDAALSNIVVVDLSRVYAGPYCTMMLGDLGATVIKVEQPGKGDDTRQFGPPYIEGESAYYLGLNRNKHSITLDFTKPEDKHQVLNLIKEASVLVENFRPGALARQGLGYEDLRELHPGTSWVPAQHEPQRTALQITSFVAEDTTIAARSIGASG